MTTAPEYQTDYNTTQAQRDAAPSLTRPGDGELDANGEPAKFMSMFELDGFQCCAPCHLLPLR